MTVPEPEDPVARELLQSVVHTARMIFGAAAGSIFLYDAETHELVFQAVSGEGEDFLVGTRFPADRGIAGWVARSGEPMVVTDLGRHPGFARDLAESTTYLPDSLMAAPLRHATGILGVLEVLDPAPQSRTSLGELELLDLFARQAATALRVVLDRPRPHPHGGRPDRVSEALAGLDPAARAAGLRALDAVRELLTDH
ncbi:GAF domain-containing protein (plasmid) [Streptomyces sp. BI20]|uniref:GAF domain-containing protein n=1 Tax=Streptomyces sp. BI20 TaxID=3403460 RepID=UPI003C760713